MMGFLFVDYFVYLPNRNHKTMMLVNIFISFLEKAVEKRKEKGKQSRFLKRVFSKNTQARIALAVEVYFMTAEELEDELEDDELEA